MFDIVDSYLPAELVKDITTERARGQAEFFALQIPTVNRQGGIAPVLKLVLEVFRFHFDFRVCKIVTKLVFKSILANVSTVIKLD